MPIIPLCHDVQPRWIKPYLKGVASNLLNREQFKQMTLAIANRRKLNTIINQMEKLSRQILFEQNPHPARRKRLSKKVLGLN